MNFADFFASLAAAGLLAGMPLLLAAVGEIFSERAGVLNLGIEGMMLAGAMSGFWAATITGSPWCGLLAGILAGCALSAIHAVGVITCEGDAVVSGLALGFFGMGISSVLGAGLVGMSGPALPELFVPQLADIPLVGRALFRWNAIVPLGFFLTAVSWFVMERTRFGLVQRATGEEPEAVRMLGVSAARQRYAGTLIGGAFSGLAGASLSLAVTPGWVDNITAGQGWIAVGLVVFSRLRPWRAALGAVLFGMLRRAILDLQGIPSLPFFKNPNLGYFLAMVPYVCTVAILVAEGWMRSRKQIEG
jgi:general nucleoside transport system permease protein